MQLPGARFAGGAGPIEGFRLARPSCHVCHGGRMLVCTMDVSVKVPSGVSVMATMVHQPRLQKEAPPRSQERDGRGEPQPSRVNVGPQERNVSMAAGAIVALQGLSRRSLPGLIEAAIG